MHLAGRGGPTDWGRTYGSTRASTNSPLGYGWSSPWLTHLTFDANGQPTMVSENGAEVPFTATTSNGTTTYTPPPWANITIAQSSGTWTVVRHKQTTFTFNSTGQLTSEADLNGNTTVLAYSNGLLSTVTAPSGRQYRVTWDSPGTHIVKVMDPMGQYVQYGYTAAGDLSTYTDPTANVWTYAYSNHLVTSVTTPNNGVTKNVFDSQGRVTSQTDPSNHTTTFAYGSNAGGDPQTTMTDPDGVVTAFTYSGGVLVQKSVNPSSATPHVTNYGYDPSTTTLISVVASNGVGWSGTADGDGNITSRKDGDGNVTSTQFNSLDEPTSIVDANNTTATLTYDNKGNLTGTSEPLTAATSSAAATTATTTYQYNDANNPGAVTAVTDPRGKTTTLAYSPTTGDLASTTDPTGAQTTYGYNPDGWKTSTTAPLGNVSGASAATTAAYTTTLGYDSGGNLVSSTDGAGHVTAAAYNADYDKVKVTTPTGNSTVTDFDLNDRPTVVHQPNGATTSTAYDPAGRIAAQIDGNNNQTTYSWDAFGDLASVTQANNKTTTYTHDSGDLLATIVDPDNRTTTQSWDGAGRLVGVSYSDGATPNVTYAYDSLGRRSSMTTSATMNGAKTTLDTTTWAYDLASRPTSITDSTGTVGYQWDTDSNLVGLTYPDGKTVTRSYDDANRWTGLVDPAGKQFGLAYNGDTDLTQIAYPNSTNDVRSYDSLDRLMSIVDNNTTAGLSNPTLMTLSNDYNASSEQMAEHIRQTGNWDQITGVDGNDRTNSYTTQLGPATSANGNMTYDAASNLTGLPMGATQSFNAADQITAAVSTPAGSAFEAVTGPTATLATGTTTASSAFGYDNEGERTSQTVTPAVNTARTPVTIPGTVNAANGWQLNGSATSSGGTLTLTPATQNQIGTAFYKTAVPSNDLHATFIASLSGGTGGDGMTFALIDASKDQTTAQGAGGGSLGFDGLDGTAFALDTYQNTLIEPTNNFVGIRTTTSSNDTGYRMNAEKIPNLRSGTHTVKVDTAGTRMTVAVDGVQILNSQVNLPPSVYVGFTAANGGATDTHAASNINITSGTTATPAASTVGYAYDQAGRLRTYTPAGGAAPTTYGYNGDGLRLTKTTGTGSNAVTQKFGWDRSGSLPTIISDSGWDYVYGPKGQPIEQIKAGSGQVDFLHVDAHNSVRLITDGTGADIGTATYNPYGAVFAQANTETSNLGYDGQYTDAESGLVYLRARMYDPATGQFLSRDPASAETEDPYGYAAREPVDGADLSGRNACDNFWLGITPECQAFHASQVLSAGGPTDAEVVRDICESEQAGGDNVGMWQYALAERKARPDDLAWRDAEHYEQAKKHVGPSRGLSENRTAAVILAGGHTAATALTYVAFGTDVAHGLWAADSGPLSMPSLDEVKWNVLGAEAHFNSSMP